MIGATQSTTHHVRSNWASLGNATSADATSATDASSSQQSDPLSQLFSSLDGDSSGGISSSELQSFVDSMSSQTRGALLSVQESSSGSTSSTSSTASSTGTTDAFKAIDSDGDGSISQSELSSYMRANMPPRDGNDSSATASSTATASSSSTDATDTVGSAHGHHQGLAKKLMSEIDSNGDGSLSQAELSSFLSTNGSSSSSSTSSTSSSDEASKLVTAMDTDGDGSVSQTELSNYLKANAPPPPPPPQDQSSTSSTTSADASSSSSDQSSSGSSSGSSSSTFSAIDTNKDGQISKAELEAYLAKTGATDSASNSSSGTDATSSSDAASSFASVMAQMLQQSYQRMQGTQTDLQSSLLQPIDSVA